MQLRELWKSYDGARRPLTHSLGRACICLLLKPEQPPTPPFGSTFTGPLSAHPADRLPVLSRWRPTVRIIAGAGGSAGGSAGAASQRPTASLSPSFVLRYLYWVAHPLVAVHFEELPSSSSQPQHPTATPSPTLTSSHSARARPPSAAAHYPSYRFRHTTCSNTFATPISLNLLSISLLCGRRLSRVLRVRKSAALRVRKSAALRVRKSAAQRARAPRVEISKCNLLLNYTLLNQPSCFLPRLARVWLCKSESLIAATC
jgi:hypothetical protein